MKINSITNPNIFHSREKIHSTTERREHATLRDINNTNNQINTTIKANSDGRVNFKGGIPSPLLHRIASFTRDNALIAEAIFALFITCGLRPLTIMATAKNDDDKAKCEYQAVKSISSGIVGLGTTAFVGAPIHRATKLVSENKKLEKKGVAILSELAEKTQDAEFSSKINTVIKNGSIDKAALKEHGPFILRKVKAEAKDSYDDVFNAFSVKRVLDGKVDIIKNPGKTIQADIEATIEKGLKEFKEILPSLPETKFSDKLDNLGDLILDGKFNENVIKDLVKNKKDFKKLSDVITQVASKEKADAVINGIKASFKSFNYFDTAKNVIDKLYQPLFMPIRAAITIALVPIILKALGKQKPSSNKQQKTNGTTNAGQNNNLAVSSLPVSKVPQNASSKNVFAEFNNDNSQQNNVAFKGITDFAVKPLTRISGDVANSDFFKKWVSKFSASPKSFTHLMVLDSVILSSFYTITSLLNKKIDKEQKPQMVINDALTLGVSAVGSYFLEDKVSKVVQKAGEKYVSKHRSTYENLGKEALEGLGDKSPAKQLMAKIDGLVGKNGDDLRNGIDEVVEQFKLHLAPVIENQKSDNEFMMIKDQLEVYAKNFADDIKTFVENANNAENREKLVKFIKNQYENVESRAKVKDLHTGLNKLKVLVVFGMIYRYLGPVLITPVANKLSDKLFGKGKSDKKTANVSNKSTDSQPQNLKQTPSSENLLNKHLQVKSTTV